MEIRKNVVSLGIVSALVPLSLLWLSTAARSANPAAGPVGLTVYTENLGLVRVGMERPLRPGSHTVRVEGLPTNVDASSLIVLNDGVTLLGTHGFRSYQSAAGGPGASIELDLRVDRSLETLRLAYLTAGLSWSASYAMIVEPDDRTAAIDGYASITNNSGTAYDQAEVQLLAGTIQRGQGRRFEADMLQMAARESRAAPSPELIEAAFGDYHLYTVSDPLTLYPGASRRIRLMGAASVSTEKIYTLAHQMNYYQPTPEPQTQPVLVAYRVARETGSEFGDTPLPAGPVRVYQPDPEGRLQLLGISQIGNTAKGEELVLPIGRAFEIVGTRTQTDYSRPAGNTYEAAWKIELRNRTDSRVTVRVIEALSGDWKIIESTHPAERTSAGSVRFDVRVPAGGSAALEFRVQVRT